MKYRSLPEAAADLGLTQRQLRRRIDQGIIERPMITDSGRYLWTQKDIDRARNVLNQHPELIQ